MTVSLELDREARARGIASRFVPTGQTGIAIAGWGLWPSTRSWRTSSPGRRSGSSSRAASVGETSSSSRGRVRSRTPRTPASRSVSSTGRRRTPSCSATWQGRRRSTDTRAIRCSRCPSSSSSTSDSRCHADGPPSPALPSTPDTSTTRGGTRGDHGGRGRDRARGGRPGAVRLRPPPRCAPRAPRGSEGRIGPAPRRGAERAAANGRPSVRRTVAAAVSVAALVIAGGAAAADIGANDDTGKFAGDAGAVFFPRMAALGLKQSVMTTRFMPSDPLTIQDGDALDRAIPMARARGASCRARRLSVSAARGRGRDCDPGRRSPRGSAVSPRATRP